MNNKANIRCFCVNCYATIDAVPALANSTEFCPRCGNKVFIPQASLSSGETIANYTVDKLIGIGAMGEVYQVISNEDKKNYALKVIRPKIISDDEIESFKNEIRMNLRVTHNNFIKAYEAGTDDQGRLFLVMEFVKGITLEDHIIQHGRFEEDHALRITLTVAQALSSAWDQWQIIHRDLKPANILISKNNITKIMDLGVSVNISENAGETHIIGTPYYMSPEQINQPDQIDQRSDIYSLGATLYELLTGTEPFQGKNSDEIFDSILTKTPLSPQRVRPDISPITCELISKLMHRDRSQRPQNWPEAIAIIDKTLNRYKEDDQHLIHHDQDTLTYCLAEDKKTFTQIILIIILSLSSFISFAYFLVNSFLK